MKSDCIVELLDDRHLGYVTAYHEVLYADVSDGAFRTYLVILRYAKLPDENGEPQMRAWVGEKKLGKERRVTPRAIVSHIQELLGAGLVARKRRRNNSTVTSVVCPPKIPMPWESGWEEYCLSAAKKKSARPNRKKSARPKKKKSSHPNRKKSAPNLERGIKKKVIKKESRGGASPPTADTEQYKPHDARTSGMGEGEDALTRVGRRRLGSSHVAEMMREAEDILGSELAPKFRDLCSRSNEGSKPAAYSKFVTTVSKEFPAATVRAVTDKLLERVEKGVIPTGQLTYGRILYWLKSEGKNGPSSKGSTGKLEKMPKEMGVYKTGTNVLVDDPEYAMCTDKAISTYYECLGCGFSKLLYWQKECPGCGQKIIGFKLREAASAGH